MLGMTILNFIAFICQMPELMYKIKHYGEEVLENDQVEIKESFENEIKSTVNETIQGITMVKNEKINKIVTTLNPTS